MPVSSATLKLRSCREISIDGLPVTRHLSKPQRRLLKLNYGECHSSCGNGTSSDDAKPEYSVKEQEKVSVSCPTHTSVGTTLSRPTQLLQIARHFSKGITSVWPVIRGRTW